jgi:hypothetical protein
MKASGKASRKVALAFLVCFISILAVLFLLAFLVAHTTNDLPPSVAELCNAQELGWGCRRYAGDNGGKLPQKLHDLVPVYVTERDYTWSMSHDFSGIEEVANWNFLGIKIGYTSGDYEKHPSRDWDYYGTGSSSLPADAILIASPIPSLVERDAGKQWERVVIYAGNYQGAVISEEEFQRKIGQQRGRGQSVHMSKSP